MANNPLLDKVMADYGQYLNKPAQGFAAGGNVPAHEANLKAYEEALANRPKIEKEKYSYKGYPLTYKNGKWEEDVPDITTRQLVPMGMGFGMAGGGGGGGGIFGSSGTGVYDASGQPYKEGMGFMSSSGVSQGPKYVYRDVTEPGYLLQYEYDPRQYEWDQYGRNIGKKPILFGGSLGGLSMAGLGEDMFKVGSSVQGGFARGGMVKGYAEGGEYDPTNPDFAGQVRENMNQNLLYNMREPVVPNVQVAAPVARPSAVDEALMQRRAIMADLNKALTAAPASSGMTDAEKYWRLAGAFGKTGKTGHFAESLANVSDTMADITAEKRKEAKELAALGLQRLQARSELANQQYALAREGEMQDLLKKYVNKGQSVTDKVTSGAADDGIPDDVKALILAQPTDKAVATIIDMAKEANKPSDLIRGVKFLVKQGAISSEEGAQIVKENLQGKLEQLDVLVPEVGGTVKLTGPEARKYYDSGELPARFGGKPKPAAATETVPTAAVKETAPAPRAAAPVITQEQAEAKKTGMVEQSKKDIEASDTLLSQKSFAKQQKDAAREVLGFANKTPKAFGVIADPTWSNAVANLVETGVNTPWGSIGLAVEEPIAKLKLTGPEAATRQLAARPIALIEVGYRKMFLKGEGAVSNMEGALTKYLGPQLSDTAKVVQIKAGMIAIGAEKQEKIVDAFEKYKESHPEAGPRSFYQTPEYKRIVASYEPKYRAFAEKNGIPVPDVDQAATKSGGSLVDRLKAERANRK